MLLKLTGDQCARAMRTGEFGPDVIYSGNAVAVVLTQSWCPQWTRMRAYLDRVSLIERLPIYFVEYDKEAFFDEFLAFKETVLKNDQVPYVRYYRDGRLTRESNYIDEAGFRRLLIGSATP
jgi:hypothetical protein